LVVAQKATLGLLVTAMRTVVLFVFWLLVEKKQKSAVTFIVISDVTGFFFICNRLLVRGSSWSLIFLASTQRQQL
jgi:hypothetical protein